MKCKRDSYLAIVEAVKFTREKLGIKMELKSIICTRSHMNNQCIQSKCPFNRKPKVAFVCVHNSCRSQIAEALGKDPTGKKDEEFKNIIKKIEEKVLKLVAFFTE